MTYSFDPDAQTEYFEAIRYYETQAEGLGARFILDVEETIGRIIAYPEAWGRLTPKTRRALLDVFPYGIVYHYDGTEIYILAVMHLKRMPRYWTTRLKHIQERGDTK